MNCYHTISCLMVRSIASRPCIIQPSSSDIMRHSCLLWLGWFTSQPQHFSLRSLSTSWATASEKITFSRLHKFFISQGTTSSTFRLFAQNSCSEVFIVTGTWLWTRLIYIMLVRGCSHYPVASEDVCTIPMHARMFAPSRFLHGKVTVQLQNGYQLGLAERMSIALGFGRNDIKIITKTAENGINHLRVLWYCRTPNRRTHERSITQKYSCRRKVWWHYCQNVYQYSIRADPNEILWGRGDPFKKRHRRSSAIWTWEGGDNTTPQTAQLFHMKKNNPYTHYYLEQQGRGMSVFRGSPWQMGHGQKGYGFGQFVSQCGEIRHALGEK